MSHSGKSLFRGRSSGLSAGHCTLINTGRLRWCIYGYREKEMRYGERTGPFLRSGLRIFISTVRYLLVL